jgi:ATP-dependent RNA helicase DDX3X
MAPTRELACQIYDVCRMFCYRTGIRPCVAYGGAGFGGQAADMAKGCHILIGTPGRIKDFVERGRLSLRAIKFLILDEADRMLDMGFEPQVRQLVEEAGLTPKTERQTLLFSATFPHAIQQLAADFLKPDYIFLAVGRVGSACSDVEQNVIQVDRREKRSTLVKLLQEGGRQRVLIFVSTKREADALDDFLFRRGFPCTSIHGDRSQAERESALHAFKTGKTPVLIATDLASRGWDIPQIHHVVLYDMPKNIEDYVHRIGRTARVGNTGKATAFFTDNDYSISRELAETLKNAGQDVPEFLSNQGGDFFGGMGGSGGFGGTDVRHSNY